MGKSIAWCAGMVIEFSSSNLTPGLCLQAAEGRKHVGAELNTSPGKNVESDSWGAQSCA